MTRADLAGLKSRTSSRLVKRIVICLYQAERGLERHHGRLPDPDDPDLALAHDLLENRIPTLRRSLKGGELGRLEQIVSEGQFRHVDRYLIDRLAVVESRP